MKESGQAAGLVSENQILANLQSFFDRFAELKKGHVKESSNVPEYIREFVQRFTTELRTPGTLGLREKERQWEESVAPNFNVFRVLRIERKEEELHSRFLAELLNPQGSHGQGDRFLLLFLEVAKKVDQGRLQGPGPASKNVKWQITTEESVDQSGRLDIVLRCTSSKYIMVIENKVDAREQQDQLSRYSTWLGTQKYLYPIQDMVFLTPNGRLPSKEQSRSEWTCLSYNENIADWLSGALPEIKAAPLRLVIEQYLKIIESL